MDLTKAFKNFSAKAINSVLPPNKLDPVSILYRALGYPQGDATFTPTGARGKDVLSAMRGRGDPLLSFNWYCELPILANNVSLGWEFVEEATTPFIEFEQQSNYRAGKMYHYPGHYSIGTMSLKLFENSRGNATNYIATWQSQMLDSLSGTYATPSEYKRPVKITIFDVAKLTAMFLTYEKCWPMRADAFNLQSASSDRVIQTMELSVDDLTIQFGKYDAASIPSIIDNAKGARTLERTTEILKQGASRLIPGSLFGR